MSWRRENQTRPKIPIMHLSKLSTSHDCEALESNSINQIRYQKYCLIINKNRVILRKRENVVVKLHDE